MSDRPKYPADRAMIVATQLVTTLEPYCERIVVAGSLRRRKPEVGDVELLFISRMGEMQSDLFGTEPYPLVSEKIDHLVTDGVLQKRSSKTGLFTWGQENKLAIHVESGIPVDLFATDESRWWNALVCRTGGKDSNLLLTTTARKKGWTFEAYGSGFAKLDGSQRHDTTSERDVFEFVGLPYLPPEQRP